MKLTQLFERSIHTVSKRDIEKFKSMQQRSDIESHTIRTEKLGKVKASIARKIVGGKLKIYRAIELEPYAYLEQSLKRRLGIFWTHDVSSAKTYRSKHGGYGEEYVIEATIKEKYIDWEATLSLNTIASRGSYENEIRLYKNTPIEIDKIYIKVNGKLIEEDISKLKQDFVA